MGFKNKAAWFLVLATLLFFAAPRLSGQTDKKIPPGSTVFIEPMDGFETYLQAAFTKKKVPLLIVTKREEADFEISGTSESQKAGWAKIVFLGDPHSREEAAITVKNRRTGEVVFSYAVHKGSSWHGKQSAAEACAKHLKQTIESGL